MERDGELEVGGNENVFAIKNAIAARVCGAVLVIYT